MRLLHTLVCAAAFCLNGQAVAAGDNDQTGFVVSNNAVSDASQWVRRHNDGIAIAVRLGLQTPVAPDVIERTLRADFEAHGIDKLIVYVERKGDGGSSVVFRSANHVWGPFGLAASRGEVAEAAAQLRFEIERDLN